MLFGSNLPTSLTTLLANFQILFTAPTFATFSALTGGFIAHVGEHSVCGMLTGAGLAQRWHHSRAHRFFSNRRWSIDQVGLRVAALIIELLIPAGVAIDLVVDDTLFRRSGPKVFGARWCYDGSATGTTKIGFGNCFVVLGVVVTLPFCNRPVCFPILCSLWQQGSKILLARRLVEMVAQWFPDRALHVTGDAAYVSRDLRELPAHITWTTRLRSDAALHDLAPPRTGKRGRPRLMGDRLPSLKDQAEVLTWGSHTITRYSTTATVEIAHRRVLWFHTFGAQPVHLVLVRNPGDKGFDIAILTTDLAAPAEEVVERYASRWSIEVAFEEAKQVTGVGDARNRTEKAVRRTVPFGLICQSLLTLWYATSLHADGIVEDRRRRAPWYRSKATPATADMLFAARRALIAAQFSATPPDALTTSEMHNAVQAWAMAAA